MTDVETDYLALIGSEGQLNIIFPEDLQYVAELLPTDDYTAENIADEFRQLADKVKDKNISAVLL